MLAIHESKKDLICLSGTSWEDAEYSGIVIDGKWIPSEDVTPELQGRVVRTMDSPLDVEHVLEKIPNDGATDFYFQLLD